METPKPFDSRSSFRKKSKRKSLVSCPYTIPPPPNLSEAELNKVDPWAALEFLRIEGLLRSEKVQRIYPHPLPAKYDLEWHVLKGTHHSDLKRGRDPLLQFGIVDLSKWMNHVPGSSIHLLSPVQNPSERILHLQIDCACPPQTIINALKPLLTRSHHDLTKSQTLQRDNWPTFPFSLQRPSPIQHFSAWLKYLRCYDLRYFEGLTYGQIAHRVYDAPISKDQRFTKLRRKLRRQSIQACRKVKHLIKATTTNWPPKGL